MYVTFSIPWYIWMPSKKVLFLKLSLFPTSSFPCHLACLLLVWSVVSYSNLLQIILISLNFLTTPTQDITEDLGIFYQVKQRQVLMPVLQGSTQKSKKTSKISLRIRPVLFLLALTSCTKREGCSSISCWSTGSGMIARHLKMPQYSLTTKHCFFLHNAFPCLF